MRTFVIKARKATTAWQYIRSQLGTTDHFEVIAHSIINAFFVANDFRTDVEIYIVLDKSSDFPRTIQLVGDQGLSIIGFHEEAIIQLFINALKSSSGIKKNQSLNVAPGIYVHGYGFEYLINHLAEKHSLYLLDFKGENIRSLDLAEDPVFILTDHLSLPKKTLKGLKRYDITKISLGRKMLFASQCIVLLNYELDLKY